jgi:hypothetical protein
MTKNDLDYLPNILPLNQEYSPEKLPPTHIEQVLYPFLIYYSERLFSSNNIYPHLDRTCIDSFLKLAYWVHLYA